MRKGPTVYGVKVARSTNCCTHWASSMSSPRLTRTSSSTYIHLENIIPGSRPAPEVQHRQYQGPPLDTILSQFHPPTIVTTCFPLLINCGSGTRWLSQSLDTIVSHLHPRPLLQSISSKSTLMLSSYLTSVYNSETHLNKLPVTQAIQ